MRLCLKGKLLAEELRADVDSRPESPYLDEVTAPESLSVQPELTCLHFTSINRVGDSQLDG